MKRTTPFILFLLILSCISGYLLSKASLVGRVGIDLFYKEYKFLKVWWQGALTVFIVLAILYFVQLIITKRTNKSKAYLINIIAFILAIVGIYFTYQDFRNTNTHRWLGERFHLGAYLFWFGWMAISIFHIVQKRLVPTVNSESHNTLHTNNHS